MQIQLGALRPPAKRIRDLNLSSLDRSFEFTSDRKTQDIIDRLKEHADYWWVPIVEKIGGKVTDVVNARLLYDKRIPPDKTIDENLKAVETDPALKDLRNLHGQSFFMPVGLDDDASETASAMAKRGIVVGIVQDEKGDAKQCFTKQDLQGLQPALQPAPTATP